MSDTEAGGYALRVPLPVVVDERCRLHEPGAEIWIGVRTPGTEVPERFDRIKETLVVGGAEIVPAVAHGLEPILTVHDPGLVDYLSTIWGEWEEAGLPTDPGQDRVVPYLFATPGLLAGLAPHEPKATWARPGRWCFDTMTLIGPGTWTAAQAAADSAVTAADLVVDGRRAVYALTRPPGHHVTRDAYGGSCYLNNAAIAAQRLRDRGIERLAILDIDAHHGNGAQTIFWERDDVRTGSVHVDPAAGWFPHVVGWADERGTGPGEGANLNVPLAPGATDAGWLDAVDRLVAFADGVEGLVVALGVDAAAADPESPLQVTIDGYREAGRRLAALGLPTVVVQEGGYDLEQLGPLVVATLEAFGLGDRRTHLTHS